MKRNVTIFSNCMKMTTRKLLPSKVKASTRLALALALVFAGSNVLAYTAAIDNEDGDQGNYAGGTINEPSLDYGLYSDGTGEAILTAENISIDVGSIGAYANGTGASVVLGGTGTEAITIAIGSESAPASGTVYGLASAAGGDLSVEAGSLSISAYSSSGTAYGMDALATGANLSVDVDELEISVTGNVARGINIETGADSTATVSADQIDITASGATLSRGINNAGGTLYVGSSSSVINIKVTTTSETDQTHGIMSIFEGSTTVIEGQSLTIDVGGNNARGLQVQSNGENPSGLEDAASLEINVSDINVTSSTYGVAVFSNGEMAINGNLTVNAPTAIIARGYSTLDINQSGENTVVLNGDIVFGTGENSGTYLDAYVNVNLTNSESSWTGALYKHYENGLSEAQTTMENFHLTLADGGTWNAQSVEEETGSTITESMAVNNLTFNGGVIRIEESTDQVVQIENLDGSGGTVYVVAATEDGVSVDSSTIQVDATVGTPNIDVVATSITSDDITDQTKAMESLYSSAITSGDSASTTATLTIPEGDVAGELTASTGEDGKFDPASVTEADNSVNSSIIDIAASNYLFFRSAINDVSSRMGDLRSMPKTAGAWVRYYGGQNKYSDKGQKEKYNTLQIGADKFINENFYLGATFSYTDGDGTLRNGSTDDKNYSFGIYGGWLGEMGQFVDVIIKRHRIETDFDLYNALGNSSGSYNNWGTSASIEAGWRFSCPTTGFYAEPQVELQLGRVDSVNYRTSRGVKVEQDGIDSIIGRAGVAVGYTFPENKGNAYAKVSVLHDWKGEVESTFSKDGTSRTYKEDLGGTWGEFAIGGTYNPTKNLSAYGQVKTSTGSPVRNPWQVSVGIRYSF